MPRELFPLTTMDVLSQNLGWFVGLWVIWHSAEKRNDAATGTGREKIFMMINAGVFLTLFIMMRRFVTYAVPLTTLALVLSIQQRGMVLGGRTRLPGGRTVPSWLSFGCCLFLGIFGCQQTYKVLNNDGAFTENYRENWDALSGQLEKHAKVAAPLPDSQAYVWAAPQADYLCQQDPVFMGARFPKLFQRQFDIWNGDEPDVPLTAKAYLDSDYVLFDNDLSKTELYERLINDPRVTLKHHGLDVLFKIKPDNQDFILDWTTVSPYLRLPLEKEKVWRYGKEYPRGSTEMERRIEGYVDALRSNPEDMSASFVHFETVKAPVKVTYELSCYGACKFWHNDRLVFSTDTPAKAILGHGVTFSLMLDPGPNTFTVQTFSYRKHMGFYLRIIRIFRWYRGKSLLQ